MDKKKILLKLTGLIFNNTNGEFCAEYGAAIATQIKQLEKTHQFGIVVGGGNLFRGGEQSSKLGISPSTGHTIGMLATAINGLLLRDIFEHHGVACELLCALPMPTIGNLITQQSLAHALNDHKTIIFVGGTGNPFFTTDTNAVLRAIQLSANELWKGTSVDGIYTKDPKKYNDAQRIAHISFSQALIQNIEIMDRTAYTMAEQFSKQIRVFNIFSTDALLQAAHNRNFGSTIE